MGTIDLQVFTMIVSSGSNQNSPDIVDIRPLLKSAHVAHVLGISIKAVHKRVREGKLACAQITARDRRFIYDKHRKGGRYCEYTESEEGYCE